MSGVSVKVRLVPESTVCQKYSVVEPGRLMQLMTHRI